MNQDDDSLYPPSRLIEARRAAGQAGPDALVVTPGADLRYLTGYAAPELEWLTCLVIPADGEPTLVVPTLERPAAQAAPAVRQGLRLVEHHDGTDPYPLVHAAIGGRGRFHGSDRCTPTWTRRRRTGTSVINGWWRPGMATRRSGRRGVLSAWRDPAALRPISPISPTNRPASSEPAQP